MFSTLWEKIKEMIRKMISPKTIEQTLHVVPIISSKMQEAIQLWTDLYEGNAPWLHEPDFANPVKVVSLGLPAFIASEKARMATLEMKTDITVPTEKVEEDNPEWKPPFMDEFGNMVSSGQPKTIVNITPISGDERANWLNEQYQKLISHVRTQLEYGIAKGGLIIKPYIVTSTSMETKQEISTIEFDYVQADAFFPLAFDGGGKMTEAAFIQRKVDKNTVYSRLEHHILQNNTVTVSNKAFKSENLSNVQNDNLGSTDLGKEIPLTDVPEWAQLQPETKIENVDRLLFGYFKMPEANTIDTTSPLGVSGYSRAIQLIREADLQYSRLLWEYEGGELAIDVDRDALQFEQQVTDSKGTKRTVTTMGHSQQRLYRPIDLGESNTYNAFSPALRDASYINGLNTILMRIEDVCALSRGTISDAAAEARTATELKILKQRSYSANLDIQKALESTLKDVVYVMNVYATLYQITTEGEYDVSFEWDDSILVDVESELGKRMTLLQNGLTSKLETRMWYFGETEEQAREALKQIEGDMEQEMEDEMQTSPQPAPPQK